MAAGGNAIAVSVDITQPDSVRKMAAAAREAFGGVDILVNNAALMAELGYLPATDIPLEQWNRIMNVNLTGALNCVQAIVPLMRERGAGKIVNQVSGGAFPALSVYGISKLALVGLTTTLARQLGREKITVNAIAPGNTMSDAGKLLTPADSPFIKMLEATVALRVRGSRTNWWEHCCYCAHRRVSGSRAKCCTSMGAGSCVRDAGPSLCERPLIRALLRSCYAAALARPADSARPRTVRAPRPV
jgi:NAD(P)-dependent dehydrogenase (short-subunit alcohol dehydrogenase family)